MLPRTTQYRVIPIKEAVRISRQQLLSMKKERQESEEKLGLSVAGWGPSSALAAGDTKSASCTTLLLSSHNHTHERLINSHSSQPTLWLSYLRTRIRHWHFKAFCILFHDAGIHLRDLTYFLLQLLLSWHLHVLDDMVLSIRECLSS
jgi:hypothetical protein